MKRTGKLVTLLFVVALVAAACGDSGGDTTTTAAPGGATTTEGGTTAPTTEGATSAPTTEGGGAEIVTDVGVDVENKVIRLGLLSDLTGIFSALVIDITDAQSVYWDNVNAAGGIGDGWTVELVIEDTNYNVEQHLEKYEVIRDNVVAITQSTGSPTNVAALPEYIEDSMLVLPLSWYSGWAIPDLDQGLAFEQNTNYCFEAMNAMEFISDMGGTSVAIVTFPGDYGEDSGNGAVIGADYYGIEVAYDGRAAVIPGQDQTQVISSIVSSGADWVFATVNPSTFGEILGGALQGGYQGLWTGASPTYDFRLLDTPLADALGQVYYQSTYGITWGTDIPGMAEVTAAMQAAYPDRRPSDAFLIGWNEAVAMRTVLEAALAAGDISRAGMVAAAATITEVDFEGRTPNQSYAGTPDEYVQRASIMLKPNVEAYTAAGGADQTLSQEGGGTTGSEVVKDFFVSDAAADYEFTAPCYEL
jgi:ABC-type branched-subunit amino acid transport system substrate-binding protein